LTTTTAAQADGLTPAQASRLHARARRRFLSFYPGGFADPDYVALERRNKARAHQKWREELSRERMRALLRAGEFVLVADTALRIEGAAKLLFSFEKMALRDATRQRAGARIFATGLAQLLYDNAPAPARFAAWIEAVRRLPQIQSRVLTWPVLTVFPFLADPTRHLYVKPTVTMTAAARWGFPFRYSSAPQYATYRSALDFAARIAEDLNAARFPGGRGRDLIDRQSFIWVAGSSEYD
jgi:hypothetical protein